MYPSKFFSGFWKCRFKPRERSWKITKYLIKPLSHAGTESDNSQFVASFPEFSLRRISLLTRVISKIKQCRGWSVFIVTDREVFIYFQFISIVSPEYFQWVEEVKCWICVRHHDINDEFFGIATYVLYVGLLVLPIHYQMFHRLWCC